MPYMHYALACAALLCVGCATTLDDRAADADAEQGELDECPAGPGQSPVSLPANLHVSPLAPLTFNYQSSHVVMSNTGRSVQYTYDRGSTVSVGDAQFELVQFHFHAHSEHALAGVLMPLELHLVHKDSAGQLLVVGVFVAEGAHNATLDLAHWPELPNADSPNVELPTDEFNAKDLVPSGPTFRYVGSLTAPPCTTNVSWILFQRPIMMDSAQIDTFTKLYSHNVRSLQDLGARALSFGE